MKHLLIGAAVVLLSGCTVTPREEPAASFVVAGDYQAVADCSFVSIQKDWNTVRQVVLASQGLVRIYFAEGGIHSFDADFKQAGAGTLVQIKTMDLGRANMLAGLRPKIEACAQ